MSEEQMIMCYSGERPHIMIKGHAVIAYPIVMNCNMYVLLSGSSIYPLKNAFKTIEFVSLLSTLKLHI